MKRTKRPQVMRRDGAGHLNPEYEAHLLALSRAVRKILETQVDEIQSVYNIEPGSVDLACFPLFALFNAAMGVTTNALSQAIRILMGCPFLNGLRARKL